MDPGTHLVENHQYTRVRNVGTPQLSEENDIIVEGILDNTHEKVTGNRKLVEENILRTRVVTQAGVESRPGAETIFN